MRTSWTGPIAAIAVMALALGGCSSSSDEDRPEPEPSATASVPAPASFTPPAGVTLTPPGTSLAIGQPATVVRETGDAATSAVSVTVAAITPGSMDDFRFFSLDEATKRSAPYYVTVAVTNDGPAGLGGASLPLFALDSSSTNLPASEIVGTFKPCPTATLPETFLPGATANLCLVYLVPEGRTLTSVNLQTGSTKDAISWKP